MAPTRGQRRKPAEVGGLFLLSGFAGRGLRIDQAEAIA
jgi:hypothetical protein